MDIFTDSHVMGTPPETGSDDTISRPSRPPSHHDVLALQSRLDDALRRNRELQARNQELEAQYKEFYRDRTQIVSKANYYEAMFNRTREKREAARAEARHYRKLARKPLALQEKVDRLLELLELLDETDITPGKTVSVAVLCHHVAKLQAELKKYRVQYSCFSRALFGRRSEKQDKKPSSRKRGQQPGGKGHGRTQRPDLETTEERHEPPADELTCSQCNAPYGANGTHQSDIIEIEVKAHTRRIIRPRYRRHCTCSGPPVEMSAPPPVRLFPNTPFGISVWTRVLCERFVSMRPARRVAAWLTDQGLKISPGTLVDGQMRMLPLFEPLHAAILAHQNTATVRNADETGWRVHELIREGRSRRAWLWVCVSHDAVVFHIDPSRSAQAGMELFANTTVPVHLVCDRYAAYNKISTLLCGRVTLAFCWAHVRRDFLKVAGRDADLFAWREDWITRIGGIYHLNKRRCAEEADSLAYRSIHAQLEGELDDLFAKAERDLAALSPASRRAAPLRSLLKHRDGLCVFLDHPRVPQDNNIAELSLREAVILRKLCFGSDSKEGARLTAVMLTVLRTLAKTGLDAQTWLHSWLTACAENGQAPPEDLSSWLPWSMDADRLRDFTVSS